MADTGLVLILNAGQRILVLACCPCCRSTASATWPHLFVDCGLCGERVALDTLPAIPRALRVDDDEEATAERRREDAAADPPRS